MRVFISNFGKGNSLWPGCLSRPAIAAFDDAGAHRFWLEKDRPGYVAYCLEHTKTQHGIAPTHSVASRWFNLVTTVVESEGDIWLHREKDELWWTRSLPESPSVEQGIAPPEKTGKAQDIVLYHKPSVAWSKTDARGSPLRWAALHPKARTFLFTEGTLQQLSEENAAYALALIAGEDLSRWERQPAWQVARAKAGKGGVSFSDDRRRAVMTMAIQAEDTCRGANGQRVERTVKNKEFGFASRDALADYLEALLKDQDELCALTGMPFDFDRDGDRDMLPSLDRIDSDGHYVAGNLQVVCRFANRWKSNDLDGNFRRLIEAVRGIDTNDRASSRRIAATSSLTHADGCGAPRTEHRQNIEVL